MNSKPFYITTPIYYVNDRPHIGHVYTTTIADIIARYHRLRGEDVFFLTGTDEHAAKVIDTARERGVSPIEWADRNANEFKNTFKRLDISNDDFIRTTEERHKKKVREYVEKLIKAGDVYLGEFSGWYDAGQEEYVADLKAKEYNYISPINKKPLIEKKEKNYFFRLSKYQADLEALIQGKTVNGQTFAVKPDARSNEVLGRIKEGLNDVPISRTGAGGWGISIPGHDEHSVYVWIDALFNYISTVDSPDRRKYWPAQVHLIAKDILWFHAVIWPALLMALNEPLPNLVYAHSFWISEGQKMSKSLGNFVDLEKIDQYVQTFSLDALRWFLAASGPLSTNDSDFAEAKFIEVYNMDLANDFGNLLNRVSGLISKNFAGHIPDLGPLTPDEETIIEVARNLNPTVQNLIDQVQVNEAVRSVMLLVQKVNKYLETQAPWKVAKTDLPRAGTILYTATECLRLASVLLEPVMPAKCRAVLEILGAEGSAPEWGGLKSGTVLKTHGPLFPRFEVEKKSY